MLIAMKRNDKNKKTHELFGMLLTLEASSIQHEHEHDYRNIYVYRYEELDRNICIIVSRLTLSADISHGTITMADGWNGLVTV